MFKNLNPAALGVSGHQSELIELALTYGFGGMDLNIVEFAARVRLKGLPYAQRLIKSAKIRIGSFPLPLEWETDDASFAKELKKLPEYAGYAAELGCTRTTAMLAPASDARPYHENFEFHRRRVEEICNVLRPSGVRLALGFQAAEYLRRDRPFQFVHDLDALSLLVNMAAAPNCGILLDPWDVFAAGGSMENIRKLPANQILVVQLADLPATVELNALDEKSRLLPGGEGGRIDMPELLRYLRQLGYDGPVSVKPSRSAFQSRRRDVIVKQTGEALDRVWRAAGLPGTQRPVIMASAE
jgi:sugar phosphate isomerase/epimerase